jgi:ribosomal protein L27
MLSGGIPDADRNCVGVTFVGKEAIMAGGKSTPKKDKALKVSSGQLVKKGQILVRGIPSYHPGKNVKGRGTVFALCDGRVTFSKKKIRNILKTFLNVVPL